MGTVGDAGERPANARPDVLHFLILAGFYFLCVVSPIVLHYICIFDCTHSVLFFANLLMAITAFYITNYCFTLYHSVIAVQATGVLCAVSAVHHFIGMFLAN
jgi:hypothetical protein